MKKMGKAKKTKIIEFAKTIMIVLLFSSCIFFCSKIFETYREQTTGDGIWGAKNSSSLSQSLTNITTDGVLNDFIKMSQPDQIVINQKNGRTIVDYASEDFEELNRASAKLVKDAYSLTSGNFFDCKIEEWEETVKKNSVYISYPNSRSVWFEGEVYQAKGYILDVLKSYDEILILSENGVVPEIFLRDREKESIIKIKSASPEINDIRKILDKYSNNDKKDCLFAYELGLDEESFSGSILEPMAILPQTELSAREITVDITRTYRMGLNFTKSTEFASGLIGIFGYNPNTVRQYMSNDDSLIFVGETGSLSVSPEGKIEYKALDANEGVLLTADGQPRPTTILAGLMGVIESVFNVSGIDKETADFDIKFTKMPHSIDSSGKIEICFDYFVDGKKLIFSDMPAIYAAVENGVLVELRMEVRDIQRLENRSQLESIALDSLRSYGKAIADIKSVYKCAENGQKVKATWEIASAR